MCVILLLLIGTAVMQVQSKVFDRCELTRELKTRHRVPLHELATWVCIAQFESTFNTAAIGSSNYGLLQINADYWCGNQGCHVPCSRFLDDDISDDLACARRIFYETRGQSGDGFSAWDVYRTHCSGGRAKKYISGC